jgi:DNA-binding NtrC family response regulator
MVGQVSSAGGGERKRILIVDDDLHMRLALEAVLRRQGYQYASAESAARALELLRAESARYDLVITDMKMEHALSGLDVIRESQRRCADVPVIVLTGHVSGGNAVDAMREGAFDYLSKPIDIQELESIVAIALQQGQGAVTESGPPTLVDDPFAEIIAFDGEVRALLELVRRSADTDASILIQGETGTGKELFARALHRCSPRRNKAMVTVNCGAIPEGLVESELFGHTRGAFTGSEGARAGQFRAADQGTIFLDEIGDMPLSAQVKLLRVLQSGELTPVGSDQPVSVNVRVVAATHRDLEVASAKGSFRSDLLYRLNVITLEIPPLRRRRLDLLPLALHFIRQVNRRQQRRVLGIDAQAQQALLRYHWPGNIRELQNVIERMVILRREGLLGVADLPQKLRQHDPDLVPEGYRSPPLMPHELPREDLFVVQGFEQLLPKERAPETLTEAPETTPNGAPATDWRALFQVPAEGMDMCALITALENVLMLQALARADGNRSEAARLLSLRRTTLVERLKRLEKDGPLELVPHQRLLDRLLAR